MKIDFIVTWVDSNDPEWIKSYNYYRPEKPITDSARFRNWDIFRYWFRAVERYAPWVNKVFLVTNGRFPDSTQILLNSILAESKNYLSILSYSMMIYFSIRQLSRIIILRMDYPAIIIMKAHLVIEYIQKKIIMGLVLLDIVMWQF